MRVLSRALLASLLVVGPASCKKSNGPGSTSGADKTKGTRKKTPRPKGMPKPLRLPKKPEGLLFVESPNRVLGVATEYSPAKDDARQLLQTMVAQTGIGFETNLSAHVGLGRPWAMAIVDGQTIVHVPIQAKSLGSVEAMLKGKAAEGEFGAVRIPRPESRSWLPAIAYLNKDAKTLTLAGDLRGIATGPELARAYGKKPISISFTKEQASRYGVELLADEVVVTGKGPRKFTLEVRGMSQPIPELNKFTNGALTGMLESKHIAAGFSTKYANYQNEVNSIISQANRQVSKQNFLVRGTLEELLKRAKSMLRHWNGRVMVGVGPARHVKIGLGADNPEKAGQSTLFFLRGILDTTKTARSFGVGGIPRIRLATNKDKGAGSSIHVVALENATRYIKDPRVHPLLNERGDLRVAFSFVPRQGGAMLAAGPDAQGVLKTWLEDTAKATGGNASKNDFVAATFAVDANTIETLMRDQSQALNLNAAGKPLKAVLSRNGNDYTVRVGG